MPYLCNRKQCLTSTDNKLNQIQRNMTQQEFFDRTMVKVSEQEFMAIHIVYTASDLDKDAFCKAWCKMNATRVKTAKRVAAIIKAHHDNLNALVTLKRKYTHMVQEKGAQATINLDKLPKREARILYQSDIATSEFSHVDYQLHPKTYGTLAYELGLYIEQQAKVNPAINIH